MILKFRIGHIRITFTIAQVVDVLGVNSKLPDGNHILMWDFDKTPIGRVSYNLRRIQSQFYLPNIYILQTSEPNNYIAYCFKRTDWKLARAIVGMTRGIDEAFYKWAVFRRRFTLRVGAKLGSIPHCVAILYSDVDEDVIIDELKSWVKYETLDGHHNQKVHFIEVP
jgi:hypothetical protein